MAWTEDAGAPTVSGRTLTINAVGYATEAMLLPGSYAVFNADVGLDELLAKATHVPMNPVKSGRAVFEGLTPGKYTVWLARRGGTFWILFQHVTIADHDVELTLAMDNARHIYRVNE